MSDFVMCAYSSGCEKAQRLFSIYELIETRTKLFALFAICSFPLDICDHSFPPFPIKGTLIRMDLPTQLIRITYPTYLLLVWILINENVFVFIKQNVLIKSQAFSMNSVSCMLLLTFAYMT